MSNQTHFESLARALKQAIDYEKGDKSKGKVRIATIPDFEPLTDYSMDDIKEIRYRTKLPQKYFAQLIGVSPRAVEAWETGKRKPTGTARRLFQLIEKNPGIVNTIMTKK